MSRRLATPWTMASMKHCFEQGVGFSLEGADANHHDSKSFQTPTIRRLDNERLFPAPHPAQLSSRNRDRIFTARSASTIHISGAGSELSRTVFMSQVNESLTLNSVMLDCHRS
jgi:hypothetical protein